MSDSLDILTELNNNRYFEKVESVGEKEVGTNGVYQLWIPKQPLPLAFNGEPFNIEAISQDVLSPKSFEFMGKKFVQADNPEKQTHFLIEVDGEKVWKRDILFSLVPKVDLGVQKKEEGAYQVEFFLDGKNRSLAKWHKRSFVERLKDAYDAFLWTPQEKIINKYHQYPKKRTIKGYLIQEFRSKFWGIWYNIRKSMLKKRRVAS